MTQRTGYVALLGRPNAGKSTLLNSLVGEKVAVVSRKPQTTRNRILGIALQGSAQILFLDTPGIHRGQKSLINTSMNRVALGAASEADLLLYLVDAERGFLAEDGEFLRQALSLTSAPCLVLLSKVDALKKAEVGSRLAALNQALQDFRAHPGNEALAGRLVTGGPRTVSAKRPESVRQLKEEMARRLPEGPWLFPEDDLTDMPRTFLCGELIREQVFRQLAQEIPYGCAVKVETLEFRPDLVFIRALIVVSRDAHKPIVLGRGGSRIKEIGTEARQSLEKHFDQRVYLDLGVRVAEGWQDDARLMAELAHMRDLDDLPGGKPPS